MSNCFLEVTRDGQLMLIQELSSKEWSFFESFGFEFELFGCNVKISLPDGWTFKDSFLYDEKSRKRGGILENSLYLSQRYSFVVENVVQNDWRSILRVFVKDSDGSVIFDAGQCIPTNPYDLPRAQDKALSFLRKKFPYWEDPTMYWD